MKSKAFIGGLLTLVLLVAAIVLSFWGGGKISDQPSDRNSESRQPPNPQKPSAPATVQSDHLALGNPGNAVQNPVDANNYLLLNDAFAISYNSDKAIANWVAWRLTASDLGAADRPNDYRPDDRLPDGWTSITPSNYTGSGFDRGHLCPSADRSKSAEAASATFLMTNITPQTPDLNQGPWEKLERYTRSLARRGNDLYIVAGSYGNRPEKLKNKVTVPTNFWKMIVVLPPGTDVSAINSETRVIAVDMPNVSGLKENNWRDYRTTIRQIEQFTGYDLLSSLPQNLQNALETKIDVR